MRLIDVDKIDFNEVFKGQSDFAKDTREAAQSLIDSQPTAYDVDKVVEKLEDHKKRIMDRKERDILNTVGKTNAKAAVEEDIEIVKSELKEQTQ